jgi:hypothetical protein
VAAREGLNDSRACGRGSRDYARRLPRRNVLNQASNPAIPVVVYYLLPVALLFVALFATRHADAGAYVDRLPV